jgi:hypothetical protein
MKKFTKILFIIIACFIVYMVYLDARYYVSPSYEVRQQVVQTAVEKNNPDECLKIINSPLAIMEPSAREMVRDCYTGVAVKTKNENICDKSENHKDYCIQKVGLLNKDVSVCDRISGTERNKAYCYSEFIKAGISDLSICKKINNGSWEGTIARDSCYLGALSETYTDISLCRDIIETQPAKDSCYFSIARATRNIVLCSEIKTDEKKRSDCEASVRYLDSKVIK